MKECVNIFKPFIVPKYKFACLNLPSTVAIIPNFYPFMKQFIPPTSQTDTHFDLFFNQSPPKHFAFG